MTPLGWGCATSSSAGLGASSAAIMTVRAARPRSDQGLQGGARQEEPAAQVQRPGIGASLVRLRAEDECVVMEYVEGPSIGGR